MVLDHIRYLVDHWSQGTKYKESFKGLAFSILVMIDGESTLPGFNLATAPHQEDKEYHSAHGENWWPEGLNIAGNLHPKLYKK